MRRGWENFLADFSNSFVKGIQLKYDELVKWNTFLLLLQRSEHKSCRVPSKIWKLTTPAAICALFSEPSHVRHSSLLCPQQSTPNQLHSSSPEASITLRNTNVTVNQALPVIVLFTFIFALQLLARFFKKKINSRPENININMILGSPGNAAFSPPWYCVVAQ